jgi:hypothetical protein
MGPGAARFVGVRRTRKESAVGFLAVCARTALSFQPGATAEPSEDLLAELPPGFEAVGEALASGSGCVDACAVAGRELARDGVPLDEALDGLLVTSRLVRGTEPDFGDARALAEAWSESTLEYLHRLTCEDPVTGLASLAHVQSRVSELYRGQLRDRPAPMASHALVVIEVAHASPRLARPAQPFTQDLRTARFADTARTVFAGSETLGKLGGHRIVVLTERDPRLGQRVTLLRRMLSRLEGGARVWIEGLPTTGAGAAALLGELAHP